MNYQVKAFDELTTKEFYLLIKERIAVFVVEQKCPYQEVDEMDPEALHTFLTDDQGNIVAYTRIYKQEDAVHFGRVLVAKGHRKSGLGKEIVQKTLEVIEQKYPTASIIIGAQDYLRSFYESFGFQAISDVYLEDDIPHIDMKK